MAINFALTKLLDTLLMGCQEKDDNIRILYGECLGELGAIEPSLLPRRIISREDSKFIFDMNEEFACAMLFENVRAFQMQKSTQSMDCFSLAIQVCKLLLNNVYLMDYFNPEICIIFLGNIKSI